MQKLSILKWIYLPLLCIALLPVLENFTFISALLCTVIVAWYTAMYGLRAVVFPFAVLLLYGGIFADLSTALILCLLLCIAISLGYCIYKKFNFSTLMITTVLTGVAVLSCLTVFFAKKAGVQPVDFLFGSTFRNFASITEAYEQSGYTFPIDMQETISLMRNTIRTMLPFLFLSFVSACVYLLFNIIRYLLRILGIKLEAYPRFYTLWLPKSISYIFVLLFLFSLFIYAPVLSNVVSFMFFIHVICGLSTIDFALLKKKIPWLFRVFLLFATITLSSLVGGIGTSVLCFMGMGNNSQRIRR